MIWAREPNRSPVHSQTSPSRKLLVGAIINSYCSVSSSPRYTACGCNFHDHGFKSPTLRLYLFSTYGSFIQTNAEPGAVKIIPTDIGLICLSSKRASPFTWRFGAAGPTGRPSKQFRMYIYIISFQNIFNNAQSMLTVPCFFDRQILDNNRNVAPSPRHCWQWWIAPEQVGQRAIMYILCL